MKHQITKQDHAFVKSINVILDSDEVETKPETSACCGCERLAVQMQIIDSHELTAECLRRDRAKIARRNDSLRSALLVASVVIVAFIAWAFLEVQK